MVALPVSWCKCWLVWHCKYD
ncbi:hypothetical protein [Salmonella enterica]